MFSKLVDSFKTKLGSSDRRYPIPEEFDEENNSVATDEKARVERNVYSRPKFLHLTAEEEEESRDHKIRPVVVPKDSSQLPLGAGYAECINGGKSQRNEDEAAAGHFVLPSQPNGYVDRTRKMDTIDVQYFGIFDGHAGTGAAVMAMNQLINHLQEKLVDIQEDLFNMRIREGCVGASDLQHTPVITIDCLVRGALEAAFVSFDEQIAQERMSFHISGGCTALVVVIMLDRIFVAHAGDCRAVIYMSNETVEMATEFTPETDAQRIQNLAHVNPALKYNLFSDNYYLRPLTSKDVGTRVLCRRPQRSGWQYKDVTEADVAHPPLVSGQGKWARLMGLIGVTRGFGDHGLVIPNTKMYLKPFLSAIPEVRVFNLSDKTLMDQDVLVMGCDGLWDMLRTDQVGATIKSSLMQSREKKNSDRYSQAAKDVVLLARGNNEGKGWKLKDGQDASFDDITAFVVPLHRCLSSSLSRVP